MDKIKTAVLDAGNNLKMKMWNIRFFSLLMIVACIMDMYLSTVRMTAGIIGEKINFSMLPFLWDDAYANKILLLLVLFFYSNVPFMEKNQFYIVIRTGKERWSERNMVYIILSSFLLNVSLVLISIIEIFPVADFSNEWTKASRMVALTDAGSEMMFGIDYGLIKSFSPWELFGRSFLIGWLVTMILAVFMYVVSLWGSRAFAYGLTACVAMLPQFTAQVLEWFHPVPKLLYFSPAEWVRCSKWAGRGNPTGLDMIYITAACVMIYLLLFVLGGYKISRTDWNMEEE